MKNEKEPKLSDSDFLGFGSGIMFSCSLFGLALNLLSPKVDTYFIIYSCIMLLMFSATWTAKPIMEYFQKRKIEINKLIFMKNWAVGVATGVSGCSIWVLALDVQKMIATRDEKLYFIQSFGANEVIVLAIILACFFGSLRFLKGT